MKSSGHFSSLTALTPLKRSTVYLLLSFPAQNRALLPPFPSMSHVYTFCWSIHLKSRRSHPDLECEMQEHCTIGLSISPLLFIHLLLSVLFCAVFEAGSGYVARGIWNLLNSTGCVQPHGSAASTSWVLGLQVCAWLYTFVGFLILSVSCILTGIHIWLKCVVQMFKSNSGYTL